MSREMIASARRDITQARRAGADPEFCVAAHQALEDCSRMYQHKLKGLPKLETGMRRERRAYYMAQYVFRLDAIAAVARAYAARVRVVGA
jgi:hypothetical protein